MRTCSLLARRAGIFAVIALGAAMVPVSAATITGSFQLAGQVTVSATGLDFLNLGIHGPSDGSILFTGGTDYFNSYNTAPDVNSPGTIKDLSAPPGGVNIANSIVFGGGSLAGATVTFTEILSGGGGACPPGLLAGSSCTLPGSPLLITRTAVGGTTVTMLVRGTVTNGADSNDVIGIFTAQFASTSPESLLGTVGAGGTVTTSYSADFQTVPEPASVGLGLVGLGLVGAGAYRRRRQ